MEKSGKKGSLLPYLLGCLVIGAVIVSAIHINRIDLRSGEHWSRYYTVVTSHREFAEEALDRENIDYLSFNRSVVRFNSIPEMTTISLSRLTDRFHEDDPRFDPFMRRIPGLFKSADGDRAFDLIYVDRKGLSPFNLYIMLNNLFNDGQYWHISGFDPLKFISPLLLFILFALTYSLLRKDKRLLSVCSLIAWFPSVFLFGPVAAIAAMVSHHLASMKRSPFYLFLSASSLILFFYIQNDTFAPYFFFFLLLGLTGSSLFYFNNGKRRVKVSVNKGRLKAKRWKKRKMRFTRPEHELFEPVRIMDRPSKQSVELIADTGFPIISIVKAAVILFVLGGAFLSVTEKDPRSHILPLPGEISLRPWSLESTSETFGHDSLISPADYIAHVAYQEGLLYRSSWAYPSSNSPLLYPVYDTSQTMISKSYEIFGDYNETWFRNQISVLNYDNPAKLLFSTESPVNVEKKPDQLISPSFLLLKFSFFMLILLLLFFSDRKKIINTSFSVRKKLLRRNEQVA